MGELEEPRDKYGETATQAGLEKNPGTRAARHLHISEMQLTIKSTVYEQTQPT